MNIIHGSSRCLARALRRAGPFLRLRRGKRRFLSPMVRWDATPRADWATDIFLAYPDANRVTNAPEQYEKLKTFYRADKYDQWQILKNYFKCPEFGEPPYVRRPRRHEGGEGFEIVRERPAADHTGTHYWRSLWERSSEYRVFFVNGRKTLTMLKAVPEGTRQDIPWNAGVSSFVTVHDENNDRLRHSRFYEKAGEFFRDYPFQLCAVDVLYRQHRHRVVEVNFSPGVLIEGNLQILTTALLNGRLPSQTAAQTFTPTLRDSTRPTR